MREEHAILDGTTLPPSDPFWNNYLPPLGWNCRCTTVQVRKDKYPRSDSAEAIAKGQSCTAKPKQQIFRFNPGKQEKIFPPKHPYLPKGCGRCQHKLDANQNNPYCKACLSIIKSLQRFIVKKDKKDTEKAVKTHKQAIHPFNGEQITGKNFDTGKITIIRSSLQSVFEHAIEDENIRDWLNSFDYGKLKSMKYKGWEPNRPYPKEHPKYDPANPNKSKHDSECYYFTYYTIKIGGREYWANVKMHKDYGETLYTIEKEKPFRLIKGHKKR